MKNEFLGSPLLTPLKSKESKASTKGENANVYHKLHNAFSLLHAYNLHFSESSVCEKERPIRLNKKYKTLQSFNVSEAGKKDIVTSHPDSENTQTRLLQ